MKQNLLKVVAMAFLAAGTLLPGAARAACMCEAIVRPPVINKHISDEFVAHRSWFISVFWEDNLLPALQMLAEQLSTGAVQQSQMMGSYMDAENQIETQQVFGVARAQAHADYQPSEGMCQFGSSVKSLAVSERRGEFSARALNQRSFDRQLGRAGSSGAYGAMDQASRELEFKTRFCDKSSDNGALAGICQSDGKHANDDINFTKLNNKLTIDANFSGDATGQKGEDEAALFALSNYLYANESFVRPGAAALAADPNGGVTNMQKNYLDMRAVIAKRSIAENSFNAIIGMKTAGSGESGKFIKALLEELGGATDDVQKLIGDNPSYYAQMEVLTKKIYQSPGFYTKLYDTPANVRRKDVSLQAIGLMQKFDMLKSYLRTEANLSMLLELEVEKQQSAQENEGNSGGGG